jgi:hypothetical protein
MLISTKYSPKSVILGLLERHTSAGIIWRARPVSNLVRIKDLKTAKQEAGLQSRTFIPLTHNQSYTQSMDLIQSIIPFGETNKPKYL